MLDSEAGSVESISTGSFGFGFERFIGFCVNASVSSDGRKHRVFDHPKRQDVEYAK